MRLIVGFTLIELMVVLVMMASLTALAIPNFIRLYDSLQSKLIIDAAKSDVQTFIAEAIRHKQGAFLMGSGDDTMFPDFDFESERFRGYKKVYLVVPDQWFIRFDAPLIIHASGICLGGHAVAYIGGEISGQITLEAPYCNVAI